MRKQLFCLCLMGSLLAAKAQSPWYEPNSWGDLVLQMHENQNHYKSEGSNFSPVNYTNRYYLRGGLDSVWSNIGKADTSSKIIILLYIPSATEFNSKWLAADNPEFVNTNQQYQYSKRPFLKYFYANKSQIFTYHHKSSWLSINPLLNLQLGPNSQWGSNYSINTRGVELRGTLNAKVGFYTRITENQQFLPAYMKALPDSLGTLPGIGWWRYYNNKTGYDFFSAKGYINFNVVKNHVNAAFGHDKFFIGNGYRSLILSDYAKEYLFLKLNTQIGPFHYQNIFAQLNNFMPTPGNQNGDKLVPRKFMAIHRASALLFHKLEIGASEMVIFDRDSADTKGFDLEYLNPVIFYRAVESNLGSRDNALIALDWKLYLPASTIFYGQFVIDEFSIKQVKAKTGYWANKFGFQAGLKSTQKIKNSLLFLQAEYNRANPYTYSHYRPSQNWSQYGQPLAHPLGANFTEWVGRALFQPAKLARFTATLTAMFAQKGMDSGYYSGTDFGGNIYRNYRDRRADFGNKILQGNLAKIQNIQFQISYMVKHNLWLDLGYQTRKQTGWMPTSGNWINFGLRLNLSPLQYLQ